MCVKNLVMAGLAALTALALTGCGLADRMIERGVEKAIESATGVSVDEDGGTITFTGEDGEQVTLSGSSAEGKLIDGFPLPIYDGAKVVSSGRLSANNRTNYSAELSFTGDAQAVADFYEKVLKEQGAEVNRTQLDADGEVTILLSGQSETKSGWITVIRNEAEESGTANLLWGDK